MKALHRIQIDIDIEAESHDEAVIKVMRWFCPQNTLHCHDSLVLEENEEVCPTCNTQLLKSGYTVYQEYNNPESQSSECKGTGT
jgi:hypothetical protein